MVVPRLMMLVNVLMPDLREVVLSAMHRRHLRFRYTLLSSGDVVALVMMAVVSTSMTKAAAASRNTSRLDPVRNAKERHPGANEHDSTEELAGGAHKEAHLGATKLH